MLHPNTDAVDDAGAQRCVSEVVALSVSTMWIV